jgi:hypothetical protein
MIRKVFKNTKKDNVTILATRAIDKMLNDARDVQDSTREVRVYIDLNATIDGLNDPSAWWRTLGSLKCKTSSLDDERWRRLIRARILKFWRKAPENSYVELIANYQ